MDIESILYIVYGEKKFLMKDKPDFHPGLFLLSLILSNVLVYYFSKGEVSANRVYSYFYFFTFFCS